jgi:hypothetical protein
MARSDGHTGTSPTEGQKCQYDNHKAITPGLQTMGAKCACWSSGASSLALVSVTPPLLTSTSVEHLLALPASFVSLKASQPEP